MRYHYGRHGPRAWLKRHKRRYGRVPLLPVPVALPTVAPPTIIRVQIAVTTERIILIVIEGQRPNDEKTVIQLPVYNASNATNNSSDTGEMRAIGAKEKGPLEHIQGRAKKRASYDVERIKAQYDQGQPITIRWDSINAINAIHAKNAIWKIFPEDESPDERGKEALVKAYQQTYHDALLQALEYYQIEEMTDTHIARIRQRAMLDREQIPPPPPTSGKKDFHQRDLAVVRSLEELTSSWDIAIEYLQQIHPLADAYEDYYKNPRKGQDWPDSQEPFPKLNFPDID